VPHHGNADVENTQINQAGNGEATYTAGKESFNYVGLHDDIQLWRLNEAVDQFMEGVYYLQHQ
jgi:hypothetical protein